MNQPPTLQRIVTPLRQLSAETLAECQRVAVQRMLDFPGVWIATDINHPGAEVPIVSVGGKLYAVKLDNELSPDRFLSGVRLHGPFRATP